MKSAKFILFLAIFICSFYAQRIGALAPEKPLEKFPPNAWGVDLMFGEGGFGLGTFLRHNYSDHLTGFVDFSISEIKDEREQEIIDPWGRKFVYGKKNRALLMPLFAGVQYRLFSETITDNLRPYITAGIGPTMVMVAPFVKDNEQIEFFSSLKYAKMKYTLGGYVGFGANFGISKKNMLGINLRYYIVHLLDEGIENIEGNYRKDLSSIYIGINIGIVY